MRYATERRVSVSCSEMSRSDVKWVLQLINSILSDLPEDTPVREFGIDSRNYGLDLTGPGEVSSRPISARSPLARTSSSTSRNQL